MAKNDLPLVLNYILTTSRQDSLVYIGHSMGCSTLFAACSLDPEVSKKIKLMIAFAPAVYLNRARSLFVKFASKVPGLMVQN
jgi:lysosomal acid lipase/cholesteryl ester hydrolase